MGWNFPDYPNDWDSTRKSVYTRAGHQCEQCGSSGKLHAHHKVSLSKGGSNSLSNLKCLCESCHSNKHPHMKSSTQTYDIHAVNQFKDEIEKESRDFANGIMLLFLFIFIVVMGAAFLGPYIFP